MCTLMNLTWHALRHPPSAIQMLLGKRLTGYLYYTPSLKLVINFMQIQVSYAVTRTFTKDLYSDGNTMEGDRKL